MAKSTINSDILSAALMGFEVQKARIDTQIAEIRSLMGGGAKESAATDAGKPKRKVSAAARRRMAKAQKLRWKKLKQDSGPAQASAAKPKRVLSAKARKAISTAQKARWAAKKTAKPAAKKAGRPTKSGAKKTAAAEQAAAASA